MSQTPQRLNSSNELVLDDKTPAQVFRSLIIQLTNNTPYVGSGTPEGNLQAPQYSLYIDEAVPLTPVQYRKMLPEIAGDRTKGWAVV